MSGYGAMLRKNKMIHYTFDNWPLYFNSDPWRRAFAFLASLSAASEDCARISLQCDDIYAAIMSYQTCQPDESVLETHNEYIDIQMSIVNSEAFDWLPRHALEVKVPYDLALDRTFYHRPKIAPVRINNYSGFFTVLHPADAHMPMLMTAGKPELVKRVVVKVRRKLVLGQNCAIVQGCV
jgi:YhcH/YjgK/YiaL family protein